MKTNLLAVIVFAISLATIHAETKFEITSKVVGYDFKAGPFIHQKEASLPALVLHSGQQGKMETIVDYRYPVTFDGDGSPKDFESSDVGFQLPISVYTKDGKIMYQGRANLCDVINVKSGFPSILKTSTPFSGTVESGQPVIVEVPTPSGGKAKVVMTIKKL